MKTLKGWLTGGILASILIFGSSSFVKADPGIIFGNSDDTGSSCDGDGGIIFGDSGIIFGGIIFGGIIFGNTDDTGCPDSGSANSGLLISD